MLNAIPIPIQVMTFFFDSLFVTRECFGVSVRYMITPAMQLRGMKINRVVVIIAA